MDVEAAGCGRRSSFADECSQAIISLATEESGGGFRAAGCDGDEWGAA